MKNDTKTKIMHVNATALLFCFVLLNNDGAKLLFVLLTFYPSELNDNDHQRVLFESYTKIFISMIYTAV